MGRKKPPPEQIAEILKEANGLVARGVKTADACHQLGISLQTYYRWRRELGGSNSSAQRLNDLEMENARLRRAVTNLTLDNLLLKETAENSQGYPDLDIKK